MKICNVCGQQSDDLSTFCTNCGNKLEYSGTPVQAEVEDSAEFTQLLDENTDPQTIYEQPQQFTQPQQFSQPQQFTQPQQFEQPQQFTQPQQFAQPQQFTQPQQFAQPQQYNQQYNPNMGFAGGFQNQMPTFLAFKAYADKAKNLQLTGIFAIIFSLGCIGLACAISVLTGLKKLDRPAFPPSSPEEAAMLAKADKQVNTAKILSYITLGILVASFVIGFLIGFFGETSSYTYY